MLPNDAAVNNVSDIILKKSKPGSVHISCSTVSPTTSRKLADAFRLQGKEFIASPVFARPDGLARRQAVWMIAGAERGRKLAAQLLESSGKVARLVVRLVNFLDRGLWRGHWFSKCCEIMRQLFDCGDNIIVTFSCSQSSIEAIAESMALAEKHGVERTEVMKLLSSTIFDCLIYKVHFYLYLPS